MLGQNINPNNFKKTEIISCICSVHNGMKIESNITEVKLKKMHETKKIWK